MDFEDLNAMPGDPHPNAKGHQIFSEVVFPLLIESSTNNKNAI